MNLVPTENGYKCLNDPGEFNPDGHRDGARWSVNEGEARLVSELCRGLRVLEIGTGLGVSTRQIAMLAKIVHTVDIDIWVKNNVELPENAIFYNNIKDVPTGLDAAFIDGLHSYEQCKADIIDAKRIVKKGGLIVFHDTKMSTIRKAIEDSNINGYHIDTPVGMAIGWND